MTSASTALWAVLAPLLLGAVWGPLLLVPAAVLAGPLLMALMHCAVTLAQTEDLSLRCAVVGLRLRWRRGVVLGLMGVLVAVPGDRRARDVRSRGCLGAGRGRPTWTTSRWRVADGELLVLVGPSGCGKSTALRMLAGLEDVSDGALKIGARVVNNIAPAARDIAMVFQSYALYPHMTVYDNLAFGLRNFKVPKAEIDRRVKMAAEILDMTELIKRKPKQLSGGQRQRVALGRAIVREPAAFLMDEPLSNLDAALRVATRAEILKLQQRLGTTTIYVTHDQVEAMTMGDRIAVMKLGVLQQVGTPEELYTRPANVFVARFIGSPAMNLVSASFIRGFSVGLGRLAGFRPEHIEVGDGRSDAAHFDAQVEVVEYLGDEQLVHLRAGETPLLAKVPIEQHVAPGDTQTFSVSGTKLHLFDEETELAVPS